MLAYAAISIIVIIVAFLAVAVRILKEYERGVVLTLGRYTGTVNAGLRFIIPGVQQLTRVDLRTIVMDVPPQDVISRDNVSVKVNAVVYFRVVDPAKAILQVERYYEATSQFAQTTLRSILGQHELDDMLSEREKLNREIQVILDLRTDEWGIKVANVEIKHIDIDETMVRAIARQAEAERARRAKVINAEGELQAAQKLREAAAMLSGEPQALQLRYLQTLVEVAGERTNTILFPLPIDLIAPMLKALNKKAE